MTKPRRKTGSARPKAKGRTDLRPDDRARGRVAVVASLVHRPDGTVRVVLDDAKVAPNGRWVATGLFTSRDYPTDAFMQSDLDDAELQKMGSHLLARLAAAARVLGER